MAEPEQPVPSWAELTSRLEGLLQRLEAPIAQQSEAVDLLNGCTRWRVSTDAATAAAAPVPSPSEREALARTLQQAGRQLAALDVQRDAPRKVAAACNVIAGCSWLAHCLPLQPEDASRYAACLTLVLESGERVLKDRQASLQFDVSSPALEAAHQMLGVQGMALSYTCGLLRSCPPAVTSSLAPPQRMLRWWRAAAGLLEALHRLVGASGFRDHPAAVACADAANIIRGPGDSFAAHRLALQSDGALCSRLTRLLLPRLAATAVGLQLPEERRPPRCTWRRAVAAAGAVDFFSSYAEEQEPAQVMWQLRLAAQLATHAPDPEQLPIFLSLLGLSAALCTAQGPRLGQLTAQQAAKLVQQLLPTLPSFVAGLSSVVQRQAASWPWRLLGAIQGLSGLLMELNCAFPFDGSSMEELRAWCAGASAALRLLMPLADLGRSAAGGPPDTEAVEAVAKANKYVCELVLAACAVHAAATAAVITHLPTPDAAAASTAVWQLHTAVCRAVHAGVGARDLLTVTASRLLIMANRLATAAPEAAPPAEAMSAAHFELARAILLGPGSAAADFDASPATCASVGYSLAVAVQFGPAAIVAHPDTEAMFARLMERLQGPQENAPTSLLKAAKTSAPAAAHLLVCGVFELAVQHACRVPDAPKALNVLQVVLTAALTLARTGEASSAAASASSEPSSRALAAALQQPAAALRAALSAPAFACAADPGLQPSEAHSMLAAVQSDVLPPARELAAALLQWWRRSEQAAADALELARAAAARSCAYLRCANLAGEGGPAAGEGVGSSKCSACRAVWYCNEACSHADWRGPTLLVGHRSACRFLGAERAAAKAAAAEQRRLAGGAGGSGGRP